MNKNHLLDHLRSAAITGFTALILIVQFLASDGEGMKFLTELSHGNLEVLSIAVLWPILVRLFIALVLSKALPQTFPLRRSNPMVVTPIKEDLTNAP